MMGIPVEYPTLIFGDKQSVLANTTMPKSMLKKNTQIIAYHFVREGCVRDEWRTAYISTHENVADILTKPLPQGGSVGNLYGCYSTIWHHRVCGWVILTVGQSAPFKGGLTLYLSWLKGISG